MQVQTERGLILVEAEYQTAERCKMDGYTYCFHSAKLGCDVYSICTDESGKYRSFALVVGF